MIDFSELNIVKKSKNSFVGIRKSESGGGFEFCLPEGFDDFPTKNYDLVKKLFFSLYRTFRKFERDNIGSNRFKEKELKNQNEQDDIIRSAGGRILSTEDGEEFILYSKIQMIEKVLEAYDEITIQSIQYKSRRTEKIDYSQIHKYLERATYLDNDVIYVETMDLPRPVINYGSADIVQLYCYILYEIVQQLDEDVPEHIKAKILDIKFHAESFQDRYLTKNQSLFNQDTYLETINILKDILDIIDKNTFYKDGDYWYLYEAIETFLYGEIDPNQIDGEYWGVNSFSLIWEDICNTYFFKKYLKSICFADTDIPLENHDNELPKRIKEKNKVGNVEKGENKNKWIYSLKSHVNNPSNSYNLGWNELLCIEFNPEPGLFVPSNQKYNDLRKRNKTRPLRRYPCPDLILCDKNEKEHQLTIVDFKCVSLDFYQKNSRKSLDKTETGKDKYRKDTIKQLIYELALQETENTSVVRNCFLIPSWRPKGKKEKYDFFSTQIEDIKGIKVMEGDFMLMLKYYIE